MLNSEKYGGIAVRLRVIYYLGITVFEETQDRDYQYLHMNNKV